MSHNNSAAATTSTAAAAAQEAFHKAQEIAARLRMVSGGNNGSSHSSAEHYGVPPPPSEQMEQPAAVASAAANHKRKRWGVMPEEEALALNNSSKKASLITPTSSAAATAAAMAKHLFTLNTTAAAAAMTTPGLSTSSSLLLSLQNHANKVPEPVASNITKRFWVTVTAEKPAAHFVAFCRDQLAEIAGRHNPSGTSHGHGTSSIDQGATREDPKDANDGRNSTDDDTTTVLQISFKGKGATNVPPLPGMPEEPLHVAVVGPKHLVEEVESPVEDLLQQAAAAPTDLVAVAAAAAAREQALVRLSSTSFRDGGGGGSSNYYKPASVATLIGQLPLLPSDQLTAALVHHGGGAMDAVTQDVAVPNGVVGCVIGRGGENIARMQALTGCKVQIQKEHELQPGQTDRIITLSASSQAAVDECHRMIQETIADRVVRGGGGGAGSNMNSSLNHHHSSTTGDKNAIPSGHTLVEVLVPDADVGLIIGKMGST